jgi:nucleoside-diphosphate kinase
MGGNKTERTFIAVKPDGVQRGLVGEIIKRFETKGYKLAGLKLIKPTVEQAREHYKDLAAKPFYEGLCQYFASGPIVAMVWEGAGVIKGGRVLLGATNPADSLPGTIRGDLCVDVGRNVCHGSDGLESAAHEVGFWFKPEELIGWESHSVSWIYE